MRKFIGFLFIAVSLVVTRVSAQTTISGYILDRGTQRPAPYVSVALYRLPDSVAVGGAITDTTGRYRILNAQSGDYVLRTFFVGYKPLTKPVTIARDQVIDLGTLMLEGDTRLLNEVNVSGRRPEVVLQADRQSYRAAQFQSATGGTATDILRNLPGLAINASVCAGLTGFWCCSTANPYRPIWVRCSTSCPLTASNRWR